MWVVTNIEDIITLHSKYYDMRKYYIHCITLWHFVGIPTKQQRVGQYGQKFCKNARIGRR